MRASILGCDGHRSIVSVHPRDIQHWSLSGNTAESSAAEFLSFIAMKGSTTDPVCSCLVQCHPLAVPEMDALRLDRFYPTVRHIEMGLSKSV